MSEQSLKVTFGTSKRRFTVPRSITFTDFQKLLINFFSISEDVTISYKDPDGDTIDVSSEEELREMFRITTATTLLLTLHTPSTPTPQPQDFATRAAEHAQEQATRAGEHAREQATRATENVQASVESVLSGIGAFLSAFGQPSFGQPPFTQPPFGQPPFGQPPAGPGFGRPRRHRRRQDFSAFSPFMAAFAPLAATFHQRGPQGMCDISETTCTAFRQLRDAALSSENRDDILRTARDVFPSVREWAMANISGEMNENAIAELCNTVSQTVQPVGGERIAGLFTEMIRAALADPAVLRILRHVPWQAAYDFEAEMRGPRGRRGGLNAGRFDVHRHVECDNCGKAPITGSRYTATNRSNYDLCSECYNNENVSKEGIDFKECKYVWDLDYPDAVVPPSPIGSGDRGPAVAFLQKILTDLGYMNASMYRWRVGHYGPNTRSAVEQFQREYGLESVSEIGQYDATTAASLTSVLEAQVPPTAATGGADASGTAGGSAAQGQPKADAPEPEAPPAQG